MKIDNHPTVLHHLARAPAARGPQPVDADRLRALARECGADDVRPRRHRSPRARRPARGDPEPVSLDEDPSRLRAAHEPRAGEEPGALDRQPRVPSQGRGRERDRAADRRAAGGGRRPRRQPVDGLSDGDEPLPRAHLGGGAQAGSRRRRPRPHGNPSQRHPPEVRQLRAARDRAPRCRKRRARTIPSTTTRAWNATCASPRVRSERSRTRATSTSRRASPTTTASSWAASTTGSSRSSTVEACGTIAAASTDAETSSLWQSLSFGPNYKSAYCMAVCPAGEDVIGPYLADRKRHLTEVVKPLQEKPETVYVVAGSDAEAHARKRFKNKWVKHVGIRSAAAPCPLLPGLAAVELPAGGFRRAQRHVPLHVHGRGGGPGDRRDRRQEDTGQ